MIIFILPFLLFLWAPPMQAMERKATKEYQNIMEHYVVGLLHNSQNQKREAATCASIKIQGLLLTGLNKSQKSYKRKKTKKRKPTITRHNPLSLTKAQEKNHIAQSHPKNKACKALLAKARKISLAEAHHRFPHCLKEGKVREGNKLI